MPDPSVAHAEIHCEPLTLPRVIRFEFRHVPLVLELVARAGCRTDDLLSFAGLNADAATQSIVVGPSERIERLLAEAGRRTGIASFGLHLAGQVERGTLGWLEYAMRSAATVDDALHLLARYSSIFNREAGYAYAAGVQDRVLDYETPSRRGGLGAHLNEFTIGLLHVRAAEVLGSAWRANRAWFAHSMPTSAEVARHFGVAVAFGQPTSGLSIEHAVATTRLETHDATLNVPLTARLDEIMPAAESTRSVSVRARSEVTSRLGRGSIELSEVARALGTSSRTLQRELAHEGATYAGLVEKARRELSEMLLVREDLTIGAIATLLGYADLRGFDRAFRRWTGELPTRWRRRHTTRPPER